MCVLFLSSPSIFSFLPLLFFGCGCLLVFEASGTPCALCCPSFTLVWPRPRAPSAPLGAGQLLEGTLSLGDHPMQLCVPGVAGAFKGAQTFPSPPPSPPPSPSPTLGPTGPLTGHRLLRVPVAPSGDGA